MKSAEAGPGRIFVIRMEDGDVVHDEIERFAHEKGIRVATLIVVGAAGPGSRLVVGPKSSATPVVPMERVLDDVHEVVGTGTLFPDEEGNPVLHMHMGCGRASSTITGCIRRGVKVWQVMEAVLFELVDSTGVRRFNAELGFQVLQL